MFHVILFQPEIPPNTGNVIRLCANSGCHLHLIEPLGFDMDDKRLRRAGLDYHEYATLQRHADLASCLESLGHPRLFAFTTKGSRPFHDASFAEGDAFLFGPESRGLPQEIRDSLPPEQRLRLPVVVAPMLRGPKSYRSSSPTWSETARFTGRTRPASSGLRSRLCSIFR